MGLGLAMAMATGASAAGLLSLGSFEKGRAWDAVGRLEIGGTAFCTGALVAPDLVLTAAHCLYDQATGTRVPPEDIQFLAGWRNGRASAYRHVRHAVHLPQYRYDAPADAARVRNDVALLRLQHPIRNTTIEPFGTEAQPESGAEIGVVSYAHDRAEAPSLQERCAVLSRQEGVVVMSCSVDFGSSGSPVFSFASGTPRIVSVVSAKADAEGRPVSLGVALDGPLDTLVDELDQLSGLTGIPGTRTVTAGSRTGTAAKVVRP
ncbi:hypothetical protein RISW2_11235 [Roseivivax isoporae LMG 25204]|uniref:Serine protease n=2 Tax=Roseivivax TaxID=93682 RepID=X7F6N8_9RHOB|nr:hypothetical protein RISW2_11235 [Roseivivax isoporae LMG 25204]